VVIDDDEDEGPDSGLAGETATATTG
jgi:hypothetical protein